ncbi:hypothetical protein KJ975_05215 [Myxococcota bacterium]|nr:hypothetical protein [Myxococcota bacterium]
MKTAKDILGKVDGFPHQKRVRFMIDLGRQAPRTPRIAAALSELEGGTCYERCLALHACYGSRDGKVVRRALADASATVRGQALTLAVRILPDEDLCDALFDAPGQDRKTLLGGLIRRGRLSAIDRFADRLALENDRRLAEVLPRAASKTVARHLEQWSSMATPTHWRILARFHAGTATGELYARLSATDAALPTLYGIYRGVLEGLVERHPDVALSLIEFAGTYDFRPPVALLQKLFRLRPVPTVSPLVAHPDASAPSPAALGRLDAAHLRLILRERPELVRQDMSWFHRLPPAVRDELYVRHRCALADAECRLSPEVIARLSKPHRQQEARTHLALPSLAADRAARIRYAAFLPWEEGFAFLEPFLSHSDADLRAGALQALVQMTAYEPAHLGRTLAVLAARKNEQDPVRQELFRALAAFPPGRFDEAHLDRLESIIRAALDATDISWVTSGLVQQVVARILPRFPAWAARQLAITVAERGVLGIPDMERRIDDSQMQALCPHLNPVVKTWAGREREYFLVILAQRLGRRLRVFPELVRLLERIVTDSKVQMHAGEAGALLWRWQPELWRELVPRMVHDDPSCLALSCVVRFANAHRQDLLTPYLDAKKMPKGRFSTGKTAWLLPVYDGFGRWTRRQQQAFSRLLVGVASEKDRDAPAVAGALSRLARIPEADVAAVEGLANCEILFTRNLAIAALARWDDDAGLPELTRCMQDDRAQIAIYAVLRMIRRMSPAAALAFLQTVPLSRVTVAKEVLRLAGSLRTEAALAFVLGEEARQEHKDVRIAILRALWNFLDRPPVWDLLLRVVRDDLPEVAFQLAGIPFDELDAGGLERFNGLVTELLARGGPDERVPVLTGLRDRPLFEVQPVLARRLAGLCDTGVPPERRLAASVLLKFTMPGTEAAGILHDTVAQLAGSPEKLTALVEAACWAAAMRLRHLGDLIRPVIERLGADPARVHVAARLAAWTQPPPVVSALFDAWAATGCFRAHVLLALHDDAGDWVQARPPDQIHAIETALSTSPHVPLRQVALSLLVALADRAGNYDVSRRARLLAFRDDPAVEVAAPAAFVILPPLPPPTH